MHRQPAAIGRVCGQQVVCQGGREGERGCRRWRRMTRIERVAHHRGAGDDVSKRHDVHKEVSDASAREVVGVAFVRCGALRPRSVPSSSDTTPFSLGCSSPKGHCQCARRSPRASPAPRPSWAAARGWTSIDPVGVPARRHPSDGLGAPDGATINADSDPARGPGMTQRLQPETTAASTPPPPSAPSASPRATRTRRERGRSTTGRGRSSTWRASWSGCRGTRQIPTRR